VKIQIGEHRLYQKATEIYVTSVDYNKAAPTTKTFYASSCKPSNAKSQMNMDSVKGVR